MNFLTPQSAEKKLVRDYRVAAVAGVPPRPVLFLGPSGVGKTETVRAAAEDIASKMGYEFIDYRRDFCKLSPEKKEGLLKELERKGKTPFFFVDFLLLAHEPTDFSGIPRKEAISLPGGGTVSVTRFTPMEWAVFLSRYPGVVFLDEITNIVRDDLKGVCYKLVHERLVGEVAMCDRVFIVAAGNSPEDSSLAFPLPAPLLNRMEVARFGAPTAEEWYRYVVRKYPDADPMLAGYLAHLASRPEKPEGVETLTQFATPRTCEAVVQVATGYRRCFGQEIPAEDLELTAVGSLGEKEGKLLSGFWRNRAGIRDFLLGGKGDLSRPAAIWGAAVIAGRAVPDSVEGLKKAAAGRNGDGEVLLSLDRAVRNLYACGGEYLVPLFLGMDAFTPGSDPRVSAAKAAFVLAAAEGVGFGRAVEAFARFQNYDLVKYLAGGFAQEFPQLGRRSEASRALAKVAVRLAEDQRHDFMEAVDHSLRRVPGKGWSEVVGPGFAGEVKEFIDASELDVIAEAYREKREKIVDELLAGGRKAIARLSGAR
ncbi:MAG: ATP-binding protein [Desulfotomaculales bacterium]